MCKKSKPSFFPIWHNIICTLFLASIFPASIGICILWLLLFFKYFKQGHVYWSNYRNQILQAVQVVGISYFMCARNSLCCAMGPKLHGMEFCTNPISEYFFRFLACSPLADKAKFYLYWKFKIVYYEMKEKRQQLKYEFLKALVPLHTLGRTVFRR